MVTDTKYYDLLGVAPDATADEIKKAYRRLSMQYHPDRTNGDVDKEALFISIKKAYETLIDDAERSRYDQNGVGSGMTSLQMEAKGILSTMFAQAIENMLKNKSSMTARFNIDNILTTIKDIERLVEKNRVKLAQGIGNIEIERDKVNECIDTVDFDGNGENLFHKVATDMFRQAESAIKTLEHQVEVNDTVKSMLEHYSDHPEEAIAVVEFQPAPLEEQVFPR